MLMSLILLNLAGGDCVDDLARLEEDSGFSRVLRRVECQGLSRQQRRAQERRWRRERRRTVPSASSMFRYLEGFCNEEAEAGRKSGSAFIPKLSEGLLGLRKVNQDLVNSIQARSPEKTATLDMDATLAETSKKDAFFCYKGFRAYQPLNVFWAEQELVLLSEFRDGNVNAGFEQRRILEESLDILPPDVEKVFVRSDTAGYQVDLLRYMAEGMNSRFGVVGFAVGADVTPALKAEVSRLKESDWQPIKKWDEKRKEWKESGQEWAEVVFVPNWIAHKKDNPDYRYLVSRERLQEQPLPGMEHQLDLPFPTQVCEKQGVYKLHAVITNRDLAGDDLIRWYRDRCGKSEEVHAVMKEDLAGGQLPSKHFGVNAAWWGVMILALNLNLAMKKLVLATVDKVWRNRRLKAVRFLFIGLPGRVVHHARELCIKVGGAKACELLRRAREKILLLAQPLQAQAI
ncbi:MAG: hypothetical protein DDT34_02476 [Firmicutes bacterium]|nr:hypothetical protein [Bacillota bacterium]